MVKKSLLTLILTAMVGMLCAQSLQFEYEGEVYENNAILICDVEPEFSELVQHIQLRNLTDSPIDVVLEKVEVRMVPGTENMMCWGMCYAPTEFILRPVTLDADTVTDPYDIAFHHVVDPTYSEDPANYAVGTSVVKYYAYPANNSDDKVCVEVWFAYNAHGFDETAWSISPAYPNPATSSVSFSIDCNGFVQATVYNLLGQEVKSLNLNNPQHDRVTFSVEDLQPGIYFCRFSVNGEVARTEKFIVKR